jgi:hypothetical protein
MTQPPNFYYRKGPSDLRYRTAHRNKTVPELRSGTLVQIASSSSWNYTVIQIYYVAIRTDHVAIQIDM